MEKYKNLIPENDLQEGWELVGRREAVMSYIECTQYASVETIYVMLGGNIEELNKRRATAKDVF